MENAKALWSGLAPRSRLAILVATVLMFVAVFVLGRGNDTGSMTLLYSGLDGRASGEVIAALEADGVAHEVRGNAIYVAATARDRLRMTLAAQGLPAMGEKGYELLDSLSGFGTTSQMFDAAYWRAKEGELARTIVSAPHIRSARVHISAPSNRPFQKDQTASAAVTIGSVGGTLSADQARALRYLVAAAVAGMAPKDVSVIDEVGGLIASGEDIGFGSGEDPRADALKAKVERLLEPRVGFGNAVVEVAVETISESEQITELRYDPEGRVMVSNEVEERTNNSEATNGGAVTVASNLPEGDSGGNSDGSSTKSSETREVTNYEISETQRQITRGPGDIKRLSVAVLINTVTPTDGGDPEPRTVEELATLRSLVASAVGFDEARGDVITLEQMRFEAGPTLGTAATAAGGSGTPINIMKLAQMLIFGVVAVIIGLFVVRPIFASSGAQDVQALPASDADPAALPPVGEFDSLGTEDFGDDSSMDLPGFAVADPLEFSGFDSVGDMNHAEEPVDRLRNLISERQDETLQVLQSWIDHKDPAEQEDA